VQETHQSFLQLIRAYWRGWNIVLFEDRGSPHTAANSLALAQEVGIEVRLLPRATPERERDGSSLAQRQRTRLGGSPDTFDRPVSRGCLQIHPRHESRRTVAKSRNTLRRLLADEVIQLSTNFLELT
jgi:hypothetical protein